MAKDHKLIVGYPGPQMAKSLAQGPVENQLYLLPALVCPQGLRTVGHLHLLHSPTFGSRQVLVHAQHSMMVVNVGVGLIKEQTLARLKLKEVKRIEETVWSCLLNLSNYSTTRAMKFSVSSEYLAEHPQEVFIFIR
ncbi:Atp-Binding Cassette Sub-Family A Member 2 [Manis pentadactyla]|nr:Atp-Binding Cassette Sub-Family A Member 2 [Manis pentadactyla]